MKKEAGDDAAEIAWKLFCKTGNMSYYMLYKQLRG